MLHITRIWWRRTLSLPRSLSPENLEWRFGLTHFNVFSSVGKQTFIPSNSICNLGKQWHNNNVVITSNNYVGYPECQLYGFGYPECQLCVFSNQIKLVEPDRALTDLVYFGRIVYWFPSHYKKGFKHNQKHNIQTQKSKMPTLTQVCRDLSSGGSLVLMGVLL